MHRAVWREAGGVVEPLPFFLENIFVETKKIMLETK